MALCKEVGSLTSLSSTRSTLIPQFLDAAYSTACQAKNDENIRHYMLLSRRNVDSGGNTPKIPKGDYSVALMPFRRTILAPPKKPFGEQFLKEHTVKKELS